MPSQLHESHLLLFQNQPTLAADLIRGVLGAELPSFREARVVSADLTDMKPTEYRADMVIELSVDKPVYAIIVEVQLSAVKRKRFVWPAYVATLHARLECPVSLLVVTADDTVARWAAKPISIGGLQLTPYVLGPSGIPEVTDEVQARENPELAVLSALAHGRDANFARAAEIARAALKACEDLDADRGSVYGDSINYILSEAARLALKSMDIRKYEYQTEFARHHYARGKAAGFAVIIVRQLAARFGHIEAVVNERLERATLTELEAIGERLLTAATLQEALGPE